MTNSPSTENATPKMDRKLKLKWLRALRSGKIQQGRGALIDREGRMCCLGVLGRIAGIGDETLKRHANSIGASQSLRPLETAIPDLSLRQDLVLLNDGDKQNKKRPRSFKEIAAWIEKHL